MSSKYQKFNKTVQLSAVASIGENPLFLIDYLMRLFRVLLLLSLWRILLKNHPEIPGLPLSKLLTYTLISEIFAQQIACRTELETSFWNGSITTRFLRPLNIFTQFTWEMLGTWTVGFCFFSLPLFLCGPLLGVNPFPSDIYCGGMFLVSIILAVMVGLAIEYLFAASAIWLGCHPYIINRVRSALGALLSGAVIPLALFPWGLGRFLSWLPFAATGSIPLRIYTGDHDFLSLLSAQIFWAVLLWLFVNRFWESQREKMLLVGG